MFASKQCGEEKPGGSQADASKGPNCEDNHRALVKLEGSRHIESGFVEVGGTQALHPPQEVTETSELFANFLDTASCVCQVHAPFDEGISTISCRAGDASLIHSLIYEDHFLRESRMLCPQFLACHPVDVAFLKKTPRMYPPPHRRGFH